MSQATKLTIIFIVVTIILLFCGVRSDFSAMLGFILSLIIFGLLPSQNKHKHEEDPIENDIEIEPGKMLGVSIEDELRDVNEKIHQLKLRKKELTNKLLEKLKV